MTEAPEKRRHSRVGRPSPKNVLKVFYRHDRNVRHEGQRRTSWTAKIAKPAK